MVLLNKRTYIFLIFVFLYSCKQDNKLLPKNDNRMSKEILSKGELNEPTELTVLPNLDILITERKGKIIRYNNVTKKLTEVLAIDVYCESSNSKIEAEEGIMGITADPDFIHNKFIYIFYSPVGKSVNRLSRFTYDEQKIDINSEKTILEFYSDRDCCNHTGGSLTFGNNRLLYLSTGDNTNLNDRTNTTHKEIGFSPSNNIKGFEINDARRTSANSMDMRGKILRIKIELDGSYSIPDGNLFPVGTKKTLPEIYVMGVRNPYRISIDTKKDFLYFGDVGPDASKDMLDKYGSKGYDELNQVKSSGFFGWPLFGGNNLPYRKFNYANGEIGSFYDVLHPVNDSKNNTGLVDLPPTSPSFIWYPYDESTEFKKLGSGSRNAMAGPVFNKEFYPKESRFPDTYDGKIFFYDFVRGWIHTINLKKDGSLDSIQPFMPEEKWEGIIDMELGPDGRLYVLEYGKMWFSRNPESSISKINYYPGNRPPNAQLEIDKLSGPKPLHVTLNANKSFDVDNDKLSYKWHLGNQTISSTTDKISFDLLNEGEFEAYVEVKDAKGEVSTSNIEKISVGNEAPKVKIILTNDDQSYSRGKPISYEVKISDLEDGTKIDSSKIKISYNLGGGGDEKLLIKDYLEGLSNSKMQLIKNYDCYGCHHESKQIMGPSFIEVANRYKENTDAISILKNKIKNGGAGNWGNRAMPAHPSIDDKDLSQIVTWILSSNKEQDRSLPVKGILNTPSQIFLKPNLQIFASYTDKGNGTSKPLTGVSVVVLPLQDFTFFDKLTFKLKKWWKNF